MPTGIHCCRRGYAALNRRIIKYGVPRIPIANTSPETINHAVRFHVGFDEFGNDSATGQAVLLDPATPDNWNDWQPLPNTLEPENGVIRHTFTIPAGRLGPHNVVVFKLSKIVADEQGE